MEKKTCIFNLPIRLHKKLKTVAFYKEKSMTDELIYILESWFKIVIDMNKENSTLLELLKDKPDENAAAK